MDNILISTHPKRDDSRELEVGLKILIWAAISWGALNLVVIHLVYPSIISIIYRIGIQ